MPQKSKKQEKERQDALKALRQELAEEITEQLPAQMREDHTRPEKTPVQVPPNRSHHRSCIPPAFLG